MEDIETELRSVLDWISEHDDDASNAAIDLQILMDGPGHGLDVELIYAAIFEDEDDFPTIDPEMARNSATGMLMVQLYSRIELVRNALPAFYARPEEGADQV